ncbi:MAG: TldD/PmbA family protein [Anaerolineales bacterium]|jgi:PmbA protein
MIAQKDAKQICQRVLSHCGSDQAEALLMINESSLTRFANNAIHQNVSEKDASLHVRLVLGKRVGTASTNRIDSEGFDQVVAQARANAQASPEDPDFPGLAEPAAYQDLDSFDERTAAYSPAERAKAVGVVCRLAKEKGLNASGAFSTGCGAVAVANSQGLFAYHAASHADFQTVVMAQDSSGWAHSSDWEVFEIPVESLGREAIEKAERGRGPQAITPGEYTVVLDPYAIQDILEMLNFHGMSGQAVLEGRSWINGRLGKPAMDEKVSIWDNGLDLAGEPMPFDFEGVPKRKVDIVHEGVVGSPVYDRYTARKAGVTSSGHALPPNARRMGPLATNLFMTPGRASLDEMIASTHDGLYITRFWYTRLVHPSDCVITGMTRDGVFRILNGELAHPVKNLRFTQSYVQALADVATIGREVRLLVSNYGGVAASVPALKVERFNFTGSTV